MPISNLPILPVITPLIGTGICLFNKKLCWVLLILCCFCNILISFKLLQNIYNADSHIISYNVGGWLPIHGIEISINYFNCIMLILINLTSCITAVYNYFNIKITKFIKNQQLFCCLYLLCITGFCGILISNDIFNIYVFLEIASLASYSLICNNNNKKSFASAFEYLIIGTIGATFYLIGVGFIYLTTGYLNINAIYNASIPENYIHAKYAGLCFIFIGIIIKSSLFPMNGWNTRVYYRAPSGVSAFLSGTSNKITIYILIKILYGTTNAFNMGQNFNINNILILTIILGILTAIISSINAIYSKDNKITFAHSSVAQIGLIITTICLNSYIALISAIWQIINHSLSQAAIFMFIGNAEVSQKTNTKENNSLQLNNYGIVIACLSLIGMPLTCGFVGKFYLLQASMNAKYNLLLAAIIFNSILSLLYNAKIIYKIFSSNNHYKTIPLHINIISILPTIIIFIIGIMPKILLTLINNAGLQIIN